MESLILFYVVWFMVFVFLLKVDEFLYKREYGVYLDEKIKTYEDKQNATR